MGKYPSGDISAIGRNGAETISTMVDRKAGVVTGWVWGVVAMTETVVQIAGHCKYRAGLLIRAFKKSQRSTLTSRVLHGEKRSVEHPLALGHIFQLAINRCD